MTAPSEHAGKTLIGVANSVDWTQKSTREAFQKSANEGLMFTLCSGHKVSYQVGIFFQNKPIIQNKKVAWTKELDMLNIT